MKLLTWLLLTVLTLLSVLLLAFVASTWPPMLGHTLGGGVRLEYEIQKPERLSVEEHHRKLESLDWPEFLKTLERRAAPFDAKEVDARRYGPARVGIFLSQSSDAELANIRKYLESMGLLQFRILASSKNPEHQRLIASAKQQIQDENFSKYVTEDEEVVGYWAEIDREGAGGWRLSLQLTDYLRNARTGELIEWPADLDLSSEDDTTNYLQEQDIELETLTVVDKDQELLGKHLQSVSVGYDENASPCINFNLQEDGANRMRLLTHENLPDKETFAYSHLAILLDGVVLSAPRILEEIGGRGRITGNFTLQESEWIVGVLQAGQLPVKLDKDSMEQKNFYPTISQELVTVILWTIVSCFVIVWLASLQYRLMGACCIAASLFQVALMLSATELFSIVVTRDFVISSAALALLTILCGLFVCWSVQREHHKDQDPTKLRRVFRFSMAPLLLLLVCGWAGGFVAYILGGFFLRNLGIIAVCGTMAGAALAVLLPLAAAARRTSSFQSSPTK